MYLHTPALEVGSWWRTDTASGTDTPTTVYAHDGSDPIGTALGSSGSTVRTSSGTARFWSSSAATIYCKELTYRGALTGTVATSMGIIPAAPVGGAPVDIATISAAVAALPTTYAQQSHASYNLLDGPQAVDASGATNTQVAFQAALNAAGAQVKTHTPAANNDAISIPVTRTFYVPDGEYLINAPLSLPQGMNVVLAPGARIKAGAAMTAIFDTDVTKLYQRTSIKGGILDCNTLADTAIYLRQAIAITVADMQICDSLGDALIVGDTASPLVGYEMTLRDLDIYRKRGATIPAGKRGVWMQYATDSTIQNVVIRGYDVGTRNDQGANTFINVHPWNPTGVTGPSICFDENGTDAQYITCYADTPSLYGWRVRNASPVAIFLARAFLASGGTHNVATAFRFDAGFPVASLIGGTVRSASTSVKWAKDIDAVTDNLTWFGVVSDSSGVVTRTFGAGAKVSSLFIDPGSLSGSTPLQVRAGVATNAVNVLNSGGTALGKFTKEGVVGAPGMSRALRVVSANYTIDPTVDSTIIANNAAGFTVTLPAANTAGAREFTIKNTAGGTITVAPAGSDALDSGSTLVGAGSFARYHSNGGTQWYRIG